MAGLTNLTVAQLKKIMPDAPQGDIEEEFDLCVATAIRYDITTKARFAAWIANVAKESGELNYVEELADGWAYEGRLDLGNTEPGDGPRYKGHGYIQITGRNNHKVVGEALGKDFLKHPETLTEVPYAWASAGYYWRYMSAWGDLNDYADEWDFESTVIGVRGGPDPDRRHYYDTAMKVLPDNLNIKQKGDPLPDPKPVKWPEVKAEVAKTGYLYIGDAWVKLESLLSGDLKTDSEGWLYLPQAVPPPAPVRWEWPIAQDAPWDYGYYHQMYPTRYNWLPERPDVEAIAREMVDKYPGKVWACTYWHHPPDVYPPSREKDSVDFWDYQGRGYAIDPAIGQAIFDELFNRSGKPDWDWAIWYGYIYGAWNNWNGEWYGDHWDHCHISFK